ncbi:MAG: pilus assembly protein PilM [Lachnospiraceae bacterium]|nr:pilus assembly protein PilM [Lachnospiraceae bacterium]
MKVLSIEISEACTYILETDYVSKMSRPVRKVVEEAAQGEEGAEGENASDSDSSSGDRDFDYQAESQAPAAEAPPAAEETAKGKKKSKKARKAAKKAAKEKREAAKKSAKQGKSGGKGSKEYVAKPIHIYNAFTIETPENLYEDGLIKDPEEFGKYLGQKLIEAKIKTKAVCFSMNSSRIAVRDVTIPKIRPNKIMNLVETNASEYFPVDIEKYRISYDIKDEMADGGKSIGLQVMAAPMDILQSYYRSAVVAGLKIQAIDYIGHSTLAPLFGRMGKGVAMVARIDYTTSLLTIIQDGVDVLQRSISYGVDEAVNLASAQFECTNAEALPLFSENNFFEQVPLEPEEGVESRPDEGLINAVDMLCSGIARVVDYYNSRNTDHKIDRIYVMGLGAEFRGLTRLVGDAANTYAYPLYALPGVTFGDIPDLSPSRYYPVLGAALAPVDLLIEDERTRRRRLGAGGILRISPIYIASALLLTGAVGMLAYSYIEEARLMGYNASLTTDRDELMDILTVYNEFQEEAALYDEIKYIYELTRNRNEELRLFVEELEEKMPSRAYLSSFSTDGLMASTSITCSSKEEAGNFIETLRDFDSVANVSVTGISETIDELTGQSQVTFSVALTFKALPPLDYSEFENFDVPEDLEELEESEEGEDDGSETEDIYYYDDTDTLPDEDAESVPYNPGDAF